MWRSRSLWAAALAVAYVSFAALRAEEGRAILPWVALLVALLLLGVVWSRTSASSDPEGSRGEAASAARACAAGVVVFWASRTGADSPLLAALGNAGALAA